MRIKDYSGISIMDYHMLYRLRTAVISALFIPLFICAQESHYKELLDKGFEYLHDRKYDEAEKALKEAVEIDPEDPEPFLMLGEVGKAKQDWSEAKDWYSKVVDFQPNNKEAHYQLGICDREDGIGRDPIRRTIFWRNSKGHFTTVMLLDSTYKQVLYEYAVLERYQSHYTKAIDLCLRQLKIYPENREAQFGIFTFYDLFLTYGADDLSNIFADKGDIREAWLKSRNTDYDLFFLGEKYRRDGEFSKADSVYHKLQYKRLSYSRVPLYLAQVRLYYETGRTVEAEKTYYRAIDAIQQPSDINFIFEDVKYILTDSDLRSHFNSLDDIKNYYREIWAKKNPLSSMKTNHRLEEHYRRMIYAEKNFRFDGFRLQIHNPDRLQMLEFPAIFYNNSKFNHKGLVYIRFGPPDDIAKQTESDMANNESWLYYETNQHPKLIFHFEVHQDGPPGDWRLVPVPTDQRMLESRLGWDRKLDQYYMAETPLDVQSAINEIQIESVKNVRRAMMSERNTWDENLEPLNLYTSTARFKNGDGSSTLEVYLGIPASDLKAGDQDTTTERIETGVALLDTTWNELFKEQHETQFAFADTTDFYHDQFLDVFPAEFNQPKFYLSAHIRDLDKPRLGGNRIVIEAKPFPKDDLAVSDLLAAYSIEPAAGSGKFVRHGMTIIPNPSKRFAKSELVNFYYEIYNLKVVDGQSLYKIDQTIRPTGNNKNIIQKFFGLFGGGKSQTVSISKEHQNKGPVAYEFTAFDFTDFSDGNFEISIKVTDLNSGKKSETSTDIELD